MCNVWRPFRWPLKISCLACFVLAKIKAMEAERGLRHAQSLAGWMLARRDPKTVAQAL